MTITARLNWFARIALAAVLTGFSFTVYWFAERSAHRQIEERLESALGILTAAAEVKPEGIEWESAQRRLSLGEGLRWSILDPAGKKLDGSDSEIPPTKGWKLETRRLESASHEAVSSEDRGKVHSSITISVAVSTRLSERGLREMAYTLAGVALAIWFAAFFLGRIVCRWALKPVREMANAARSMGIGDLQERLPMPTSRDELRDLGQAFNSLLDRVAVAYRRQGNFTAEASHQLKTPLTGLLGQIDVALRRPRTVAEHTLTMESLQRQGQRLQTIVESLLFLARADAEAALPQRVNIDAGTWITEHIAECWKDNPRFTDLHIEVAKSGNIVGHPGLLGELVNVLIDNAFKYSEFGTSVNIEVRGSEFSVSDLGSGISTADRERLFEPFFRSDSARLKCRDGLGLGLAIARRIAVAHGGTLELQSSSESGSTFLLRLYEVPPLRNQP